MLSAYAVPILVMSLMLFVPGYLALRCLGARRTLRLCCAPVITIALVSVLGQLFAFAGITASPANTLAPLVAVPALCLVTLVALRKRSLPAWPRTRDAWVEVAVPALFALIGMAAGANLLLQRLPEASSILQCYDVTQHLNAIRAIADSGRFTSVGVGYYMSAADAAIDPVGFTQFYPSAWHVSCALFVQLTGASVPVAINVSMYVFSSLVFPLGVAAFLSQALAHSRRTRLAGAIVACAFVSFPWVLLIFGPLYPNLAALACVPAAMALFVRVFERCASRSARALAVVAFLASCAGLVLMHPNAIFTAVIILAPWCVHAILAWGRQEGLTRKRRTAFACGFVLFCVLVWVGCYKSPFFSDIVNHVWPAFASPVQELVNILTQTYTFYFFYEIAAQVLLGILVIVGLVRAAYDERTRWMAVSYGLACLACFVCATNIGGPLVHLLGGFWYTDAVRLAAVAVLAGIPLAAIGLTWVIETLCDVLRRYNKRLGRATHPRLVAVAVVVGFLVLNFLPSFDWPGAHVTFDPVKRAEMVAKGTDDQNRTVHTTFGDYRAVFNENYLYNAPLSPEEETFLERVRERIGSDELVLNNPMDGSFLAYGAHNVRVYYRDFTKFHNEGLDNDTSKAIRLHLREYATDPDVQAAVKAVGARYVLVLSEVGSEGSFVNLRRDFMTDEFEGISSITDETPGFTLLERSGDLALYEINE